MTEAVKGKVWKFLENVDTDQIIPAEYLVTGDPDELARHSFEKVRPEFAGKVQKGDIIVATDNFGCGSSREHAPLALIGNGISVVIARSFARIFFRNSINIGLPLVEADVEADDGDDVEVDFGKGIIRNITKDKEFSFNPLPDFLLNLLDSGGLVEYTRTELAKE